MTQTHHSDGSKAAMAVAAVAGRSVTLVRVTWQTFPFYAKIVIGNCGAQVLYAAATSCDYPMLNPVAPEGTKESGVMPSDFTHSRRNE